MNSNQTLSKQSFPFNLIDYLKHVNLSEEEMLSSPPSLEKLKKIITHHNDKFIYHNKTLVNEGKVFPSKARKIPSLDPNDILNDMVTSNGGYCFQHLELLYAVLLALEFEVKRYLSNPIFEPCSKISNQDNTEKKLKTHELLIVELEETRWIVDLGIGDLNLLEPVELKEGKQSIDNDKYRLSKTDNKWSLDTKMLLLEKKSWLRMYDFFDCQLTNKEDIEKIHTKLYKTKKETYIRDTVYFVSQKTSGKKTDGNNKTPEKERKSIKFFLDGQKNSIFSYLNERTGDKRENPLTNFEEAQERAKEKLGLS